MYKYIIVLSLLGAAINANLIGWRNCGSHLADVYAMRIANCTHTPCVFVRGQSYMIEVEASSRANSNALPFASVATILGMPVTLFEGNACDHLSLGNCPARIGYTFAFRLLFQMPSGLPTIPVVVTSILRNDYGDVGICVEVDVNIA